jgi:hypothetical protein
MHSFWRGEGEEEHHGLLFTYYSEEEVLHAASPGFDVVAMERYAEMEAGDSFYALLRKVA